MNRNKLSQRLEAVVNHIPDGAKIADIGSDHAYLPCFAVKHRGVPFAVAGEVVQGPYMSALEEVQAANLSKHISVRKGNGLAVLQPGEVDCIIIAGMGGPLITTILDEGKEKLTSVTRLILQPNVGAIAIRKWFLTNGWELIAEEILEEDGKIYEILVAEKGNPYDPYNKFRVEIESGCLLGPFLQNERNHIFIKKWTMEKKKWVQILAELDLAVPTEKTAAKKKILRQKIAIVEEVITE